MPGNDVNDDYYGLEITRIPIGRTTKNPESTYLPVRLAELSEEVFRQRWKAMFDGGSGASCYLEIRDNGASGDGVFFKFCIEEDATVLFETFIPDAAARTIEKFLRVIRELREDL